MATKQDGRVDLSYHEVTIALLKAQGIHEGYWKVWVDYGPPIAQQTRFGETRQDPVFLASIVPIVRISLVRTEMQDELTVDAKVVNPESQIVLVH